MPANTYRKSHINYTKKIGGIDLDFAPTIVRLRIPLISTNKLYLLPTRNKNMIK